MWLNLYGHEAVRHKLKNSIFCLFLSLCQTASTTVEPHQCSSHQSLQKFYYIKNVDVIYTMSIQFSTTITYWGMSNFAMGTILGKSFPQAQVHTVHSMSAEGPVFQVSLLPLNLYKTIVQNLSLVFCKYMYHAIILSSYNLQGKIKWKVNKIKSKLSDLKRFWKVVLSCVDILLFSSI